jgi:hypothetical protein
MVDSELLFISGERIFFPNAFFDFILHTSFHMTILLIIVDRNILLQSTAHLKYKLRKA